MLHGPGVSLGDEFTIETGGGQSSDAEVEEATVTSRRDPTSALRILLPCPVQAYYSVSLSTANLHLEAKLPAPSTPASSSSISVSAITTHALSASELRRARPATICCARCDRGIAGTATASTADNGYRDLPSEHWAEMMEVWMCHQDETCSARLAKMHQEGFWPTRGHVLVGSSYLLLNHDDVKRSDVRSEDTKVS